MRPGYLAIHGVDGVPGNDFNEAGAHAPRILGMARHGGAGRGRLQ